MILAVAFCTNVFDDDEVVNEELSLKHAEMKLKEKSIKSNYDF